MNKMHPINQELIDADMLCGEVPVPEDLEGYFVRDDMGSLWDVTEPDEFFQALRWMIITGKSRVVLRGPHSRYGQYVMYDDGDVILE